METLGKGMIHVLGRTDKNGARFHHATQNGTQFKMYELFISGIFHLIFLDLNLWQVTRTADKGTARVTFLYSWI